MAEAAIAKGNAAFTAGRYVEAIKQFSMAITLAPANHVLYSKRSAAYALLHMYDESLEDAQKTVEIKPDCPTGYSRLGAAYVGLGKYEDASSVYRKGLELHPRDEGLKSGLADAEASARSRVSFSSFGNISPGSELWEKLRADPKTRTYLEQPDFVRMIGDVQGNRNNINLYLGDQRMMQVLGVLLNVNLCTSSPEDMEKDRSDYEGSHYAKMLLKSRTKQQLKPKSEPEPMDIPEEKEKGRKADAQKEKEGGDVAYKKKDFEAAIQHYTKAADLDDEDISYIINRASVCMEMGKYDDCINYCDKAVERCKELQSDFKTVPWPLTRQGTAYIKTEKSAEDYEPAIESFQKVLTKHHNPDTLEKLNDAKKAKKDLEQQEYFDPKHMKSRKSKKKVDWQSDMSEEEQKGVREVEGAGDKEVDYLPALQREALIQQRRQARVAVSVEMLDDEDEDEDAHVSAVRRRLEFYFPHVHEHELLADVQPTQEVGGPWKRAAMARDLIGLMERQLIKQATMLQQQTIQIVDKDRQIQWFQSVMGRQFDSGTHTRTRRHSDRGHGWRREDNGAPREAHCPPQE